MAQLAADDLASQDRKISRLLASPLERTQQSAAPVAAAFSLKVEVEPRIIEPSNVFEGKVVGLATALRNPSILVRLLNPIRPGWGEAYESIRARMFAAIEEAAASVADGDVILVTHQLPIVMVQRSLSGRLLAHNPRVRRCSLSSITTLEKIHGKWVEIDYREPAIKAHAVDRGAA
jgi:broad specificity phosphatase PhoE